MSAIRITRTTHLSPAHREQFRAIYEASFPPAERQDFSLYAQRVADGERWFFGAFHEDALIGFATFAPHLAPNIHLLEYLAVAADARSGGIGGQLLDAAMRALGGDVFLEVESDDACAAEERALCQRRIRFYQRHGAQIVTELDYRVPRMDAPGILPMKLMWLSPRGNALPRGAQLRAYVRAIYTRNYDLAATHPLVQMLQEKQLALELMPDTFAICRLPPDAPIPVWARGAMISITRTRDELSIVCAQSDVPDAIHCERDWRALRVSGTLAFELTGILASLATPLAEAGISIFALSTFDTDYVLVKQTALDHARAVLTRAGHRIASA